METEEEGRSWGVERPTKPATERAGGRGEVGEKREETVASSNQRDVVGLKRAKSSSSTPVGKRAAVSNTFTEGEQSGDYLPANPPNRAKTGEGRGRRARLVPPRPAPGAEGSCFQAGSAEERSRE